MSVKIENKVFEKMTGGEAVELNKSRVDLTLLSDFETLYKNTDKNAEKSFSLADKASKEIANAASESISQATKAINLGEQLKNKAKDLGLPIPKDVQSMINSLEEDVKLLKSLRKAANQLNIS